FLLRSRRGTRLFFLRVGLSDQRAAVLVLSAAEDRLDREPAAGHAGPGEQEEGGHLDAGTDRGKAERLSPAALRVGRTGRPRLCLRRFHPLAHHDLILIRWRIPPAHGDRAPRRAMLLVLFSMTPMGRMVVAVSHDALPPFVNPRAYARRPAVRKVVQLC